MDSIAQDMDQEFRLMVAPLQGLTEAAWRAAHFEMFRAGQGRVEYFTPFIRLERGEVRKRDLRDFTSELNHGMPLTPQIIFRDVDEWKMLTETVARAGAASIDMNLGCPFVPQVRKGRGAGMLGHADRLALIAEAMDAYAGTVAFSVKMRLGVSDPGEVLAVVDILNAMPLRHVAVHPRTAAQQYKGSLRLADMQTLTSRLRHPVIFNGEISSPDDIAAMCGRYAGVMVGRGLLARPTLFAEYCKGAELPAAEREAAYLDLLARTCTLLEQRLCGAAQLRDKMKPYWDYAPATLDKKILKQSKKTGTPSR